MIPIDLFSMIVGVVLGIMATVCVIYRNTIFSFDEEKRPVKRITSQQAKVINDWIEEANHDHAA